MTRTVKVITAIGVIAAASLIGAISWASFLILDGKKGARLNKEGYEAELRRDHELALTKLDAALRHRLTPRGRSVAYHNRGVADNWKWKFDDAIRDFTEALRLDHRYVNAYIGRSFAYSRKGDRTKAIKDLDSVIQLDPNSYDAYYARGMLLLQVNQTDRALNDFAEAIRCNPDSANALVMRGVCYAAITDFDHALANFDAAIFTDPKNALAYWQRAILYLRQGQREKGELDREHARRLDRNVESASNDLTRSLAQNLWGYAPTPSWPKFASVGYSAAFQNARDAEDRGDYDKAIELYNVVLQMDITGAQACPALMNRGNAYRAKGDKDRALVDYDESIRSNPNNAGAYVNRGLTLSDKGKLKEALKDYEAAIRLKPDQWEAYFDRAALSAKQGDAKHAIDDLTVVMRLNPKYANAYLNRAAAYSQLQKWSKALDDCNAAVGIDSSLAQAYAYRAIARANSDEPSKAWADLQKAISLDPKKCFQQLNDFAWHRATSSEKKDRNGKEAVAAAIKACEATDWKDWSAIDTLAAAYAENGDFDQAVKFQRWILDMIEPTNQYYGEAKQRLELYEQHKPYREPKKDNRDR